jgi:hypothetical protein
MKIVEAKPPAIVIASIAVPRLASRNQVTTTANAASYSTPADATPSPNNTAYSATTPVTCDQASRSSVASTEQPTMSARPPRRSSQRPAGTAASAAASSETVWAPVTTVRSAPNSSCIGTSRTANA